MSKLKNIVLLGFLAIGLSVSAVTTTPTNLQQTQKVQAQSVNTGYLSVNPLDLVAKPSFYVNKNIIITAKFDKFVTLGLDYKPAFRSSEDYISFLIQRPDVSSHNIPLSELKIFLKRKEAEKFIELNSGDEIEIKGKVFSDALTDAWVEVVNLKVINAVKKEELRK